MKSTQWSLMVVSTLLAVAQTGWAAERAQGAALPAVVKRGLSAFKTNGGRAAVENWLRGGPLEHSKGENEEIDGVQDLERLYGRYQGFALLKEVRLSPVSRLYYLEVQLLEGPIYFRLRVYAGKQGEHVVGIKVDPVPDRLLPEFILEEKGGVALTP